jgi:hypothetical protein
MNLLLSSFPFVICAREGGDDAPARCTPLLLAAVIAAASAAADVGGTGGQGNARIWLPPL